MLLRARVGGLGLCSEPATATARWWPLGGSGLRGEGRELQRAAKKRWRRLGGTRGCQREEEVARGGGPERWAVRRHAGGRASRGVGLRWKKMDCFAISEISRDPNVNNQ